MSPRVVLMLPLLAVVSATGISAGGCQRAPSPAGPATGSTAGPARGTEVVLQLHSGAEVHVAVEIARSEGERARGLMYRRSLEGGSGMLFLFPKPDHLKFWMRNTYIPLDMIFLGEDHRVNYVEENAEPLTDSPRGPEVLSQYVLEVPGGWARTHGIEPGVTARFVGVP